MGGLPVCGVVDIGRSDLGVRCCQMPDGAPAEARLLVHVLRAVLMAAWMSGRVPRRVPLCVWLGRLGL